MKYGKVNLGQVEAILNKIDGTEGIKRILSGQTEVKFKVWKKIMIGVTFEKELNNHEKRYERMHTICEKLYENGCQLDEHHLKDCLLQSTFEVSHERKVVNLVKITPKQLGLKTGTNYSAVALKAKTLGLNECHPEVPIQLRLNYKEQPKKERIQIAMSKIIGSIFAIEHTDNGVLLITQNPSVNVTYKENTQFVFEQD